MLRKLGEFLCGAVGAGLGISILITLVYLCICFLYYISKFTGVPLQ